MTDGHRTAGYVVARITSPRAGGETYEIRLREGAYSCSCKTFLFCGRCSHATAIAAHGLTAPLEEIH